MSAAGPADRDIRRGRNEVGETGPEGPTEDNFRVS